MPMACLPSSLICDWLGTSSGLPLTTASGPASSTRRTFPVRALDEADMKAAFRWATEGRLALSIYGTMHRRSAKRSRGKLTRPTETGRRSPTRGGRCATTSGMYRAYAASQHV